MKYKEINLYQEWNKLYEKWKFFASCPLKYIPDPEKAEKIQNFLPSLLKHAFKSIEILLKNDKVSIINMEAFRKKIILFLQQCKKRITEELGSQYVFKETEKFVQKIRYSKNNDKYYIRFQKTTA